ncbi:unnamed protein product [Lactuca saligna]|uniref:Uncharacterized protein n=1 Tax=Lactuca saligna TaxID=75948 RepID=A0AA35Z1H2_LACSI|nr:unnamed protein product [Lactuca saligna]
MFSSTKWEECKFSSTPKGIASYKTVSSVQFWSGVGQCLKVFSPLVKVLRMVDADWKPSMGFVYEEINVAKEEIITSLVGNEKAYKPIIDIINKKMKANLMEKNQKRKDGNMEVLLTNDSLLAKEWIVDVDELDPETVNEDLGTNDNQAPRESPRRRELSDENFESECEEEMLEEDKYESDGVQIMEVCGED